MENKYAAMKHLPFHPKFTTYLVTPLLIAGLLGLSISKAGAEYYQYINEDGVLCFTDDKGNIPEAKTDSVVIHKERFDDVDTKKKSEIMLREQKEIDQIKEQRKKEIERYDYLNRIREIKQAEIERKKRLVKMRTPVTIANNQILVPVKIGYSDRTVTTTLILDTGASITVLDHSIADTLKITRGKRSSARVAGGGVVKTKLVDLQFIQVGPKKLTPHKAMIISQKGPEMAHKGLLGLDFLRRFDYSIDYQNQLIIWKE